MDIKIQISKNQIQIILLANNKYKTIIFLIDKTLEQNIQLFFNYLQNSNVISFAYTKILFNTTTTNSDAVKILYKLLENQKLFPNIHFVFGRKYNPVLSNRLHITSPNIKSIICHGRYLYNLDKCFLPKELENLYLHKSMGNLWLFKNARKIKRANEILSQSKSLAKNIFIGTEIYSEL